MLLPKLLIDLVTKATAMNMSVDCFFFFDNQVNQIV